jgi:hypothetical protein
VAPGAKDAHARPAVVTRPTHISTEDRPVNKIQTQVLQWARRVRDFLIGHDVKSDLAELTTLRQELDDTLGQLTADAAAQEAVTKQSRVQTTEIKRLRKTLRDTHLKPIVRMSRTMELEINGSAITFVLPKPTVNSERLAAAGTRW